MSSGDLRRVCHSDSAERRPADAAMKMCKNNLLITIDLQLTNLIKYKSFTSFYNHSISN